MKEYLEVGEIVTTHGLAGDVKLYLWCDGPEFVKALPRIFFGEHGERELTLENVRVQKDMCILKFVGIDSIEDARTYLRKKAYFKRSDANLPEGRYFVQDVIGCAVKDADTGKLYGTIQDINHSGAHDVYTIVDEQENTYLFPAVAEFLISLDPFEGLATVRPIPGMFDGGAISDAN